MMATRKRAAEFFLEKPLVSRLPFEVEQPQSIAVAVPHKRPKVAAGELDERQNTTTLIETSDTRWYSSVGLSENDSREEIGAVGVDFGANRDCWFGKGGGGKGDSIGGRNSEGEDVDCSEKTLDELSATSAGAASAPALAPGRGSSALVQLKIDAMFAAPRLAPKRCGVQPGAQVSEGAQRCTGPSTKSERGMDVDAVAGLDVRVGGQPATEGESQAACYACRSGLGTEGGDILCSFCDRAACQGCWQKCFACEIPHCSLCLAADYSSQFECYFCPPCYQDRRLESR
ncbi:unnamed protein product [Hapterophycus canaliculatus]